eukprot:6834564-Prorocentrum_lima.AAC.1
MPGKVPWPCIKGRRGGRGRGDLPTQPPGGAVPERGKGKATHGQNTSRTTRGRPLPEGGVG